MTVYLPISSLFTQPLVHHLLSHPSKFYSHTSSPHHSHSVQRQTDPSHASSPHYSWSNSGTLSTCHSHRQKKPSGAICAPTQVVLEKPCRAFDVRRCLYLRVSSLLLRRRPFLWRLLRLRRVCCSRLGMRTRTLGIWGCLFPRHQFVGLLLGLPSRLDLAAVAHLFLIAAVISRATVPAAAMPLWIARTSSVDSVDGRGIL